MPGLYIPFRDSSSSTSRPAGAPPASFCRHTQVAPTAPIRSAVPAFHTSAKRILDAAAAQPICPKLALTIPKERTDGMSSCNYSSSGSLHPHDPSSVCLAAMVHEFLEEGAEEQKHEKVRLKGASVCGRARCNCVDGACEAAEAGELEGEHQDYEPSGGEIEELCAIFQGLTNCSSSVLLEAVANAVEELMAMEYEDAVKLNGRTVRGRAVMSGLRKAGYNAAACKSRWNHGDGLHAGDYEYVDVIMEGKDGKEERIIVDIHFKEQFEIARPSKEYARMLNVLPDVYVGRAERIKRIVKMMSRAAKRSLKTQGLMMPPWRRRNYMQAKCLSPLYRRTTNDSYMMEGRNTQREACAGAVDAARRRKSMGTGWPLPCVQEKPIKAMVSALSHAMREQPPIAVAF